jgi:hypothetical protein
LNPEYFLGFRIVNGQKAILPLLFYGYGKVFFNVAKGKIFVRKK